MREQIPMSEQAMGALSVVGRLNVIDKRLEQLGLWSKLGIMSAFKEPEILDDLVDHWGAAIHEKVGLCMCVGRVFVGCVPSKADWGKRS